MSVIKTILIGDAMIHGSTFEGAWKRHLPMFGNKVVVGDFETDWSRLQYRRLEVEKQGPEIEGVDPLIEKEGADAEMLMGLFIAVNSKVMDAMPHLRLVGVSRAGLENVNVQEASKRGILVFNVKGRNAHAVSDFTVAMMLGEARNIARAHNSVKAGEWRKTFSNNDCIPEMHDKVVGLVGFGHIGRLVAKKLSGFDVEVIVYDPYTSAEAIEEAGCKKVELDEVLKRGDFISLHARLSDANYHMIGREQLAMMKPTAIFVNTARAGLVDYDALTEALQQGKIMGAALDVFETEPLPQDSPLAQMDNVTYTTHIAGTTADALNNSPYLLMADVAKLFNGGKPSFIVNPEVLEHPAFKAWLERHKG